MVWFSIHIDQEFGMKTFNINLILDPFRDIPRKNISIQIRYLHDGTMNARQDSIVCILLHYGIICIDVM